MNKIFSIFVLLLLFIADTAHATLAVPWISDKPIIGPFYEFIAPVRDVLLPVSVVLFFLSLITRILTRSSNHARFGKNMFRTAAIFLIFVILLGVSSLVPNDNYGSEEIMDIPQVPHSQIEIYLPKPGELVGLKFYLDGRVPISWLEDRMFEISLSDSTGNVLSQVVNIDSSVHSEGGTLPFTAEIDTSGYTAETKTCFGEAELEVSSLVDENLSTVVPIDCGE